MKNIQLPKSFAIKKSITNSFGSLYQSNSIDFDIKNKIPLIVKEKSNAGPIMRESGTKDEVTYGSHILQRDECCLDIDKTHLHLHYKVNISNFLVRDTVTDSVDYYENAYLPFLAVCKKRGIIKNIVEEYVRQVVSGACLNRNLDFATNKKVVVYGDDFKYSFDNFNANKEIKEKDLEGFNYLVDIISDIINDFENNNIFKFNVVASVELGDGGVEIYPSQLMNLDSSKKNREYYKYDVDNIYAGITAEKIGNANRTIDHFYSYEENVRKIPVYAYGNDRATQTWLRDKTKGAKKIVRTSCVFHIFKNINTYLDDYENIDDYVLNYAFAFVLFGGLLGLNNKTSA